MKTDDSFIPVLMYHALEDAAHPAGARDAGEQLYILPVEQFRQQMAHLQREGYRTCLLDELTTMAPWPNKAVVLTFDDGHESNYTLALPILQEYGLKAHFFVTTGWSGTEYFMTPGQIRELHAASMGIGSHGVTHSFVSDLDDAGIDYELSVSKQALERIIGAGVTDFSAPGGRCDARVAASASRLGYRRFITSEVGLLSRDKLETAIPRCTIRAATTLPEFAAMVAGDSATVNRMAAKSRKLGFAKMVLGNRTYNFVRKILLR